VRGLRLLPSILIAGLALGCEAPASAPPSVSLGAITWRVEAGDVPEGLDEAAVRRRLERLATHLTPPSRLGGPVRLDFDGRAILAHGELALELRARLNGLSLPAPLEAAILGGGAGRSPVERERVREGAFADLERALTRLVGLAAASPAEWRLALGAAEPDEQILAIRLLGARRAPDVVSAIVPLLQDPRDAVVEAAVEGLARQGDREAVRPLIDSLAKASPRHATRVLSALARLGGDEARSYLEMVARGDENEALRQLASRLLVDMKNSPESL